MNIVITEDKISIINNGGYLMASWKKESWIENPNVVFIIAEAIKIAKEYPQGLIPFFNKHKIW